MSSSEVDSRSISLSMRKSVENLVISSQDAIGQSISQALNFSGVISQHANQIMQETRSVSRSPSPSPRHTDAGPESLDNDKCSETSLVVPSGGSGDSASVSSASELATIVGALPSRDSKVTSPTPPRGAEGGSRAKKKSWYTALYPTYKNKSDDFKRLFKDLPDDERLIVDYSCALQKDILVHGRLYASQNYLCFHASIFSWETSLALRWKDVTAITKEKTALVIPNAILVCAAGDKNFLTSFSGRDKAYLMLFRIWQNALMDQPMTSQEIWQWVHSCYGEELGFNSDDEGYGRDFPEESSLPPDAAEDLVESMEATGGGADEGRGGRGHAPSARDSDPPLVTNGDAAYREEEGGDTLPTDMSDTSDSDDKPHNGGEEDKCTASHEGQPLLHQEVPFNIDQLFTMMFTNSKFNLELLAARGTTDYVQAPWQVQGGLKCRQISYTLGLTSGPIGPKEVHVTETQVMNKCSKPGVMYSIDACSENSGIPYADYFSVRVHYCLARIADSRTSLAVIARLHYKKTMWNTIKGFLEKNTISGLEAFCRLLAARLHAEADAAPAARKRRQRRNTVSAQETAAVAAPLKLPAAGGLLSPRAAPRGSTSRWLLGCVLLLLLINALLYWRLHQAIHRQPSDKLVQELGRSQAAQWGALLQAHAARQRGELRAWRTALDDTRNHLHQTEQALMKLLETIKPSLEGAPPETQPPEEPPPPTPSPDL